ncbi:MAG: copper amine oxidase N-terminal domain-containing protein [Vulcanimicrobiaceae bacterium]
MGRAACVVYALFLAAGLGVTAGAASAQPAPDYGSPPSGQYPILFNDHHVYAKPDVDKQNRVLAALVRGNTILVPLRSMFEQMGATVEYDPMTRTAIVAKPGSEVRVTVGKPEVVINGESRPLDVPPEIHEGVIMVPVRVISEGMGAYVMWVPEKRAVVVRYIPAPPPTPVATPAPTPKPTDTPIAPAVFATPAPVPTPYYDRFVSADIIPLPRVYNEFTGAGTSSSSGVSNDIRAAVELPITAIHLMLDGQYSAWRWTHPTGPVTQLGGAGASVVNAFGGVDQNLSFDFGIRVAYPRVYFIEGYMSDWTNYGYPRIGGIGYGLEKLPDLDQKFTWNGRFWFGSSVHGHYDPFTVGAATIPGGTLSYRVTQYEAGLNWNLGGGNGPLFAQAGFQGEYWSPGTNAPAKRRMYGPYAGLGVRF